MFEQIMRASEAAASHRAIAGTPPVLFPALWGCAPCDMTAMIASPVWGDCRVCGARLTLRTVDPARPDQLARKIN